jgi:hypothetical protein
MVQNQPNIAELERHLDGDADDQGVAARNAQGTAADPRHPGTHGQGSGDSSPGRQRIVIGPAHPASRCNCLSESTVDFISRACFRSRLKAAIRSRVLPSVSRNDTCRASPCSIADADFP